MALNETIIWTAVPNGIDTSGGTPALLLSVHVAPNLTGGATGFLSNYPDFNPWTAQAVQFRFTLDLPGGSSPTIAGTFTDVRRDDFWTALFPPATTKVSPRDSDEPFTGHSVISFPADKIADTVQSLYTDLAANTPEEMPTYQSLLQVIGNLGYGDREGQKRLGSDIAALASERTSVKNGKKKRANDWSGVGAEEAFAALRAYHAGATTFKPIVPALPIVDFHRALSFVAQHPRLQRVLGLVFDVRAPLIDLANGAAVTLPASPTPVSYITVEPVLRAMDASYHGAQPRTTARLSTTTFEAAPSTSQIAGGQLTLGDGSVFRVHQMDVDGAGIKTAQLADTVMMSRQPAHGTNGAAPDAPDGFTPPALQTGGLAVTAVNRGVQFVGRLDRGDALLKGLPAAVPDLSAEDLVRGFVLDVHDSDTGNWHSTAQRHATYALNGVATHETTDDEAATDAPPAAGSTPTEPRAFRLSERLVRWDGWSLAGARPGKPVQDDGTVGAGGVDPGPFSQMAIDTVPYGLPRLRFGKQYALRMRIVDIAGNVIPLSAGAAIGDAKKRVSAVATYARHEPVPSPDLYHHDAPVPGESLTKLVIRGNYDADASGTTLRTVAPPRVAEFFAELHGLFDKKNGSNQTVLDPNAYALIVGREAARYQSDPPTPIDVTAPVLYLPDVLSRGAALRVMDGALAGQVFKMDFNPSSGKAWPDYRPFGLLLGPSNGQNVVPDASARLVTVKLDKADVVTMRLSSTFAQGDLGLFGIYGWVSAHFNNQVPAAFRQAALDGRHWALTPWTAITFVYAVRQPLLVPEFLTIDASRQKGWTYANVRGELHFSRKSTGRIDMLAAWDEPVDNGPGTPAPDVKGLHADVLAFEVPVDGEGTPETVSFLARHEFGDTKHRVVAYRANATSRFSEHFAQRKDATVGDGTSVDLGGPVEPGSVVVHDADGRRLTGDAEGPQFTTDPAAGNVVFHGIAPGTAVTIESLPPVSRPTPAGGEQTRNIRSSARPASPQVVEALPIFSWSPVARKGNTIASQRTPAALRVFLDRPWWSSGAGELLGVVTWNGTGAALPQELTQLVTDWGQDPVFGSRALPAPHPRPAHFPAAVATATALSLDERPGALVDVAGHQVKYDTERDLWYADIQVNTGGAYTPMLRLALARFQPDSVGGVELSRVVLADVMSLDPGRAASIVRAKDGHGLSSVTLTGLSYTKGAGVPGPGHAQLVVERRDTGITDDTLGWTPVGPPIPMAPRPGRGATTTWTARDVKVPKKGKHRVSIEQYEVLPADRRGTGLYRLIGPPRAARLLFQDVIEL